MPRQISTHLVSVIAVLLAEEDVFPDGHVLDPGLLRHVGHRRPRRHRHLPRRPLHLAQQRLQQGALPGAHRADHGHQAARPFRFEKWECHLKTFLFAKMSNAALDLEVDVLEEGFTTAVLDSQSLLLLLLSFRRSAPDKVALADLNAVFRVQNVFADALRVDLLRREEVLKQNCVAAAAAGGLLLMLLLLLLLLFCCCCFCCFCCCCCC